MKTSKSNQRSTTILFLLLIVILECFFFRKLLESPYAMIGDRGDARFLNLIMEHWYKVFRGKETVQNLCMFYPVENTISYSDMLLGMSLPYSLFRVLGANMFLANKITLMGIHFLGSFSLFYLLKCVFRLEDIYAFLGVISFSFANGYSVRIGHTQMMALSFVPLLVIFFSLYVDLADMHSVFSVEISKGGIPEYSSNCKEKSCRIFNNQHVYVCVNGAVFNELFANNEDGWKMAMV